MTQICEQLFYFFKVMGIYKIYKILGKTNKIQKIL